MAPFAKSHVPAWETADFVEAAVRGFGLLIGDDAGSTNWEVRRFNACSQRTCGARPLTVTPSDMPRSAQAFGRGVAFFEALLDKEAEPNQGAGRAACRAGLRGNIARALRLKPELARMPESILHGVRPLPDSRRM